MSSLDLSEFKQLSKPKRPECTVATALERLDPEQAALLRAALEHDRAEVTHVGISAWLSLRDMKVQPTTVGRHRNGDCSCAR